MTRLITRDERDVALCQVEAARIQQHFDEAAERARAILTAYLEQQEQFYDSYSYVDGVRVSQRSGE